MEGFEPNSEMDDELTLTVASALRAPMRGDLERLIASELAMAVLSLNPLQKIRHILEAYLLLSEKTQEQLFTEAERLESKRLYEVCISLLNVFEVPTPADYMGRYGVVPWSFLPENAHEYFYWLRRLFIFKLKDEELEPLLEQIKAGSREAWRKYCSLLAQHLANLAPLKLIKSLESEFIVYATPVAANVMRKIFGLISERAWSETLSALKARLRRED